MDELDKSLEYVIYCRRSSDESSEKQVQSIPDQINKCMQYAEQNGIRIKEKPEDFSNFETEREIINENNDESKANQKLYKDTRHLFIIKEQQSGKIPFKRPKRRKLMKLIEQGKIKGLLSYSPDRQSRNILEGGELINFVDEEKIELKYTNFHFENNAAGKMMLGIWFVFSKQYSDKLSEDTKRGMESKFEEGRSLGTYKHGYYFLPSGHHLPHPQFFDLWEKAFKMKIEENRSDNFIAGWLKKKGYVKQKFNDQGEAIETKEFKGKNMHTIRRDSFYYGLYSRNDEVIDLNKLDTGYKPMISQEDHQKLIERYFENIGTQPRREVKDELLWVLPTPEDFVRTPDGYKLSFSIPNKRKRFYPKLRKLQLTNPDANLGDVVEPHQITYRCSNSKSKYKGLSITYADIEKVITHALDKMNISDEAYEEYKKFIVEDFQTKLNHTRKQKRELELQKGQIETKLNAFLMKNMGTKRDAIEEESYKGEKKRLSDIINSIQADLDKLKETGSNEVLEYEAIFKVLQKASQEFVKLNYVQKRKIVGLLFSNITINDDLSVDIYTRPGLEDLFEGMGRSTGIEPAANGTTTHCSTTELRPPYGVFTH